LDQLQGKFDNVSKEVFGKCMSGNYFRGSVVPLSHVYPYVNAYTCFFSVDDMTRRLDELEASMAGSANETASATSAK